VEIPGNGTFTVENIQGNKRVMIHLPISAWVKNFGNSPALSEIHYFSLIWSPNDYFRRNEPCKRDFESWEKRVFSGREQVVFPSEEKPINGIGATILNGGPQSFFGLSYIGCVFYRDASGKPHYTGAFYLPILQDGAKNTMVNSDPLMFYTTIKNFVAQKVDAN
jgi:hypothetical protein